MPASSLSSTRSSRWIVTAGALLAATGVALGAFAAHGLRSWLAPAELGWWETAVQYQMWHATGLLAIGAMPIPARGLPAALLAGGTILFSGSLYAMALGAPRALGMITPLGGTAMMAGWLLFAWRASRPDS